MKTLKKYAKIIIKPKITSRREIIVEKVIKLPRLALLTPTMESTLLKIMEESGELARAVLSFLETPTDTKTTPLLQVAEELLDVAQTCVTMIFVIEDAYQIDLGELIGKHLHKLSQKGYHFDQNKKYYIQSTGEYKYLNLPKLLIPNVTLLKTVCKIQEEIGELTQIMGKKAGKSGETTKPFKIEDLIKDSALELLDIAQCCFTMLYILDGKHNIDMDSIFHKHLEKLKSRGYY